MGGRGEGQLIAGFRWKVGPSHGEMRLMGYMYVANKRTSLSSTTVLRASVDGTMDGYKPSAVDGSKASNARAREQQMSWVFIFSPGRR